VLRPDRQASEAELLSFLGGRLARFKVPKRVIFHESLPISAAGKILKRELKESLQPGAVHQNGEK
jgi:fatty-acyl-CoA synthase